MCTILRSYKTIRSQIHEKLTEEKHFHDWFNFEMIDQLFGYGLSFGINGPPSGWQIHFWDVWPTFSRLISSQVQYSTSHLKVNTKVGKYFYKFSLHCEFTVKRKVWSKKGEKCSSGFTTFLTFSHIFTPDITVVHWPGCGHTSPWVSLCSASAHTPYTH